MNQISKLVKMFPNVTIADSFEDAVATNPLINYLPEEVLIEIFDCLDKRGRIAVTRTCLRWQKLILTDSRFTKHHQLTLDNGVELEMDHDPVSMFMESDRKFGVLRLGDVKFGQNLDEFWKKLAESVTHLIIKEFSPYSIRSYFLAEIVSKFKRLRVLEFEIYHVDREIIRIEKRLPPYPYKWPTVEVLKLGDSKFEPENYEFFEIMMPKLKEIYFGKFSYSEELLKKYASKIKSINIAEHFSSIYLMYRMGQIPELIKLTHLEVVLDSQIDALVEYINNHPALESVAVLSRCFPRQRIPKMHKLNLDLSVVINSFAPLSHFGELRELHVKLSNYDSNCFFGHEVITKPNLRSLSLCNFSSHDCKKCNQCMFESFPNLKSFSSESCFVSKADVVGLISQYSPGLEHLTNKYFVTENFCLNDSLLKWAEMKELRTCYLNPVGAVS